MSSSLAKRASEAQTFGTVAQASSQVRAGDSILLAAGEYSEHVVLTQSGTTDNPIVIEAEAPGSVVFSGDGAGFWAGLPSSEGLAKSLSSAATCNTISGIEFRDNGNRPVVRTGSGWRVENCLFERVCMALDVRNADNVVIIGCTFQDIECNDAHAIIGVYAHGCQIVDCTIRRVNTRKETNIPHSAVVKFLFSNNVLVENVLSEDNCGPGWWFDWENRDFTIRNCTLRNNYGRENDWEGPGMWLEGNPAGNSKVHDNLIEGNTGGGVAILESNGIEVYSNTLIGNGINVEIRNLDRGDDKRIGDLHVHDNYIADWIEAGIGTTAGDWGGWDAHASNVRIDNNRYAWSGDALLFRWVEEYCWSINEVRDILGFEYNGVMEYPQPPQLSLPDMGAVVVAVNVGGAEYTASSGIRYEADMGYHGGFSERTDKDIADTPDDEIYQTNRYGSFGYHFGVPVAEYELTLQFAEAFWSDEGQRLFDVRVEGQTVIDNLDICAEVGPDAPYDVRTTFVVADGALDIEFSAETDYAIVSGLVVRLVGAGTDLGFSNPSAEPSSFPGTTFRGLGMGGSLARRTNGPITGDPRRFAIYDSRGRLLAAPEFSPARKLRNRAAIFYLMRSDP
ncbi:MAG: hypothetical protein GF418_05920 [Chitinivibrionales bacterium]|nr:hypothetical protein [Chitinivibrionales bacterium]MBD3395148.1 hypothetical protein [Chitinivibrionales bacterium]